MKITPYEELQRVVIENIHWKPFEKVIDALANKQWKSIDSTFNEEVRETASSMFPKGYNMLQLIEAARIIYLRRHAVTLGLLIKALPNLNFSSGWNWEYKWCLRMESYRGYNKVKTLGKWKLTNEDWNECTHLDQDEIY